MKTVVTVTGIRPDFIRMSEIFKKLDQNFKHILIHTGQHYDKLLSDVFFEELEIRKPDYNLEIGGPNKKHYHQSADLSVKLIELLKEQDIKPDIILFLGDSNSVTSAVALKKEGYIIGHIEAGMRSGDRRMLEEINRMVCDVCSDIHFVYHENYKFKLYNENIYKNVHVVGNTIVEVANKHIPDRPKKNDKILLDIHRPENFLYKDRMVNIFRYISRLKDSLNNLPVYMLGFPRTLKAMEEYGIKPHSYGVEVIDLLPFKKYLEYVYDSRVLVSDSGTAQEEPALLKTPVIVPRDYTERPESFENHCSYMLSLDEEEKLNNWPKSIAFLNHFDLMKSEWLGDGTTSDKIISLLKDFLK